MKSIGKLGGQNKVPRLSNDRKIASELENILSKLATFNSKPQKKITGNK